MVAPVKYAAAEGRQGRDGSPASVPGGAGQGELEAQVLSALRRGGRAGDRGLGSGAPGRRPRLHHGDHDPDPAAARRGRSPANGRAGPSRGCPSRTRPGSPRCGCAGCWTPRRTARPCWPASSPRSRPDDERLLRDLLAPARGRDGGRLTPHGRLRLPAAGPAADRVADRAAGRTASAPADRDPAADRRGRGARRVQHAVPGAAHGGRHRAAARQPAARRLVRPGGARGRALRRGRRQGAPSPP